MSGVAEETRKEVAPTLSPWDVVLWKLDLLDKRIEAMDQGLNRRIDRVEERMDREIGGLRGELSELRQEVRSTRASFTILEFTAVFGFLAVLVSIWIR